MKQLFANFLERICHWQSTVTGILLAVLMYFSMGYAIQKDWAKFSEAAMFVSPILMVVFGSLFKPKNE